MEMNSLVSKHRQDLQQMRMAYEERLLRQPKPKTEDRARPTATQQVRKRKEMSDW
jgi:hypothetical protein